MGEHNVNVWVNPLIFFGAEFRPNGLVPEETSYNTMMGFLCRPGIGSQVADLVRRYNEISIERNRLPIAPGEPHLLDRLIWPLRDAKASYVVGNYLGTIALCGMVGEMAAVLAFDMHNEATDPVRYDVKRQSELFGRPFERLGQDRRINVLASLGVISAETRDLFESVRTRRNRYLHDWSKGHAAITDDAIACYDACLDFVAAVLGMRIDAGRLVFREEVFLYLNKHGVATPWQPPVFKPEGYTADQLDETDPTDPAF